MGDKIYTIGSILESTDYDLNVFSAEEISDLDVFEKNGKPHVYDIASKIERKANPEEVIRQLYVRKLHNLYSYSKERISVEKSVRMGRDTSKSADIVVSQENNPEAAYIIVEVKKPGEESGIEQLKTYCNAQGAPLAVWTNGGKTEILYREEPNKYQRIPNIPSSGETLENVLNKKITIDDLERKNLLASQKWTLKKIILDLENLVLANAGVDPFEEVFKLVYAKLYDEWKARRRDDKSVKFRIMGESDQQLYDRINNLFNSAKDKWSGVFVKGERIDLSPSHLKTCVSFLQDIRLFNSNLQIIDEAFEYLVTQVAKASKGQYFTPRHVIDMCVDMINPKIDENIIDPAAGSCGFTVHTMFHVWGGELTSDGPTAVQSEYARNKVYGLDFDSRAVKVAKALNLIAGDGKTNVFRANTLDPDTWNEEAKAGLKDRLRDMDDYEENKQNERSYRYFDFDIVLTNPPFSGDIRDNRVLHKYELAKSYKAVDLEDLTDEEQREKYAEDSRRHSFKERGYFYSKQSRDVLFVERSIQLLKPGGRLAIVLPQGLFNNLTSEEFRWWVGNHARIHAVVGLHENTFKPHTNTKTSVLFAQKWNDDESSEDYNPYVEDYPIFFAESQHPGKDSSGDYIFVEDKNGEPVLDLFNHQIVDHDLFDTKDVLTQQLNRLKERDSGNPEAIKEHERRFREIVQHIPQRETIAENFESFAKENDIDFN